MTATAWAHLPNAALIDAVIADAKVRPEVWKDVWRARGDVLWDVIYAAEDAAYAAADIAAGAEHRATALDRALDATRDVVSDTMQDAHWHAIRGTLFALIAWDDCAHLLDLPSTTLRTMIDLCDAPACHQAVMLLPYVLAKESK